MSHATVTGNIVNAPEVRFSKQGNAVANFTVVENQKNGDEEKADFYDCVAFKTMAENIGESLQRGMRVIVTGRLQQSKWETEDGQKRSKVELVVNSCGPDLLWATASVQKNERPDQ